MGRLEELAAEVATYSDEELLNRVREIRKSRNMKKSPEKTAGATVKRTDTLKKLLGTLSKEELAALLKGAK